MEAAKIPAHYASADEPTLRDRTWLEQQWDIARLKAGESKAGALLVLDEIQKVTDWSRMVKLLWDADTHSGVPLKVVLLGSSPLLIQSGLTESLAGRFEVIAAPHWSFTEMRAAFGWSVRMASKPLRLRPMTLGTRAVLNMVYQAVWFPTFCPRRAEVGIPPTMEFTSSSFRREPLRTRAATSRLGVR